MYVANSGNFIFQKQVINIVICAAYQIWWERNDVIWNSKVEMVYKHVYRIKYTIIDRIYTILPKKISRRDKMWLREIKSLQGGT